MNNSPEQLAREAAVKSAWSAFMAASRNYKHAKEAYQEARAAEEAGEAELDNLQD